MRRSRGILNPRVVSALRVRLSKVLSIDNFFLSSLIPCTGLDFYSQHSFHRCVDIMHRALTSRARAKALSTPYSSSLSHSRPVAAAGLQLQQQRFAHKVCSAPCYLALTAPPLRPLRAAILSVLCLHLVLGPEVWCGSSSVAVEGGRYLGKSRLHHPWTKRSQRSDRVELWIS